MSMVFVPLFFFASLYAQIALGQPASEAGLYLLTFFGGFAAAAQVGGRVLDSRGARPAVVPGCALAAVGFALWAAKLPDLSFGNQWPFILLAGVGIGLILGPVSTDAVNRASRGSYGEVTGITQTSRNFGASLGLAVLGTILILRNEANIESTLGAAGVPKARADRIADALSGATGGGGGSGGGFGDRAGRAGEALFKAVQHNFALSARVGFYLMAAIMVLCFVVALVAMPGGRVEAAAQEPALAEPQAPPAPVA